jgi:hypothetical protein
MNPPELEHLMDLARRRVLRPDEVARLTALLEQSPEAWPDRDAELALTRLLKHLPDAPLSSNFSARVMQAIDLEDQRKAGARPAATRLPRWLVRLGWATATVAVVGESWFEYQDWQRAETARSIQVITEVAAVPSVEVLRDFEVIPSFARVPPIADMQGDLDLLNALQ